MKTCSKCGQEKPLELFYKHKPSRDGRRPDCKACLNAQGKEYRKRPEVIIRDRAYHKKYNKNMPREQRDRHLVTLKKWFKKDPRHALTLSRFNALRRRPTENAITIQELVDMWKAQEGKCAISGITMTWRRGRILPTSISLDRLDGSGGYTKDNLRLLCYSVNAMRQAMADEDVYHMALAIVTNMKKPRLRLVS